ncbi:hypothetical protein ACTFIW_006056 [Dictyostelium discoideum]
MNCRPPQPSLRDESQITLQSNQELQLATKEGSLQLNPTSIRSNPDGLFSSLLNYQTTNYSTTRINALHLDWILWKQCLASPTPILLPSILEKMNSSSWKKVYIILIFPIWKSATWYPMIEEHVPRDHMFLQVLGTFQESIPIKIQQRRKLGIIQSFQSNVMSITRIKKSSTAELLMKSWEPSTLKVYSSSHTRFRNFCTLSYLYLANITLVVFIDYLTHMFKHGPLLAFGLKGKLIGHAERCTEKEKENEENEEIQFEYFIKYIKSNGTTYSSLQNLKEYKHDSLLCENFACSYLQNQCRVYHTYASFIYSNNGCYYRILFDPNCREIIYLRKSLCTIDLLNIKQTFRYEHDPQIHNICTYSIYFCKQIANTFFNVSFDEFDGIDQGKNHTTFN